MKTLTSNAEGTRTVLQLPAGLLNEGPCREDVVVNAVGAALFLTSVLNGSK